MLFNRRLVHILKERETRLVCRYLGNIKELKYIKKEEHFKSVKGKSCDSTSFGSPVYYEIHTHKAECLMANALVAGYYRNGSQTEAVRLVQAEAGRFLNRPESGPSAKVSIKDLRQFLVEFSRECNLRPHMLRMFEWSLPHIRNVLDSGRHHQRLLTRRCSCVCTSRTTTSSQACESVVIAGPHGTVFSIAGQLCKRN